MIWRGLLAGAVGAIAVTVLHEAVRRTVPHAPRLDVLGMRAIAWLTRAAGSKPPRHLHKTALGGDLASNSAYYGMVGLFPSPIVGGLLLGTAAGAGSVLLPGPLGLGEAPTTRTRSTAAMAVALYTAGGLAAGATYAALARD